MLTHVNKTTAIAFHNAVTLWLVYPGKWDDLDSAYNDGFLVYACLVTVAGALLTEAMEWFFNWRLRQPIFRLQAVLFWEHIANLVTAGLSYIIGSAWSNVLERSIAQASSYWIYAFIYAVGITTIAAAVSFGVTYFYPNYNTKIIDVDFEAFKPKEKDLQTTA